MADNEIDPGTSFGGFWPDDEWLRRYIDQQAAFIAAWDQEGLRCLTEPEARAVSRAWGRV
jgi:hypothetical protein